VKSFVVPAALQSMQSKFDVWRSQFHINCCDTHDEYLHRLGIFAIVDAEIEAHNRAGKTWTKGHNRFSHMTNDEIRNLYGPTVKVGEQAHCPLKHEAPVNENLPDSVDWRTSGAVSPVKDQGSCGSCWSFSSSGSLEGAYFLKHGKQPSVKGFSEQNLIDCDGKDSGCGGGRQDWAFQFMKNNGGLATEEDYPYEGQDGQCKNTTVAPGSNVTNCVGVTALNDDALKSAVAQQPVSVVVDPIGWSRFSAGVITSDCPSEPCHAVLVVGYGTDESIDCDIPPKKGCPYWLVKDSYGVNHAEEGYVKVQRGGWPEPWGGMCGILIMPLYPVLGNSTETALV